MRRLFLAVTLGAVMVAGWLAVHSAAFNAELSSEALVQSLAPDYLAVDHYYGGVTNPVSDNTALQRLAPPRVPLDTQPYRPTISITRAEDGIRLAHGAEAAIDALGATAQLVPIRAELERSYRYVEQSWHYEQQVEEGLSRGMSGTRVATTSTPDIQRAADQSVETMRQASALHENAIAALRALTSPGPTKGTTAAPAPSTDQSAALDGHYSTSNHGAGGNAIGRLLPSLRSQP